MTDEPESHTLRLLREIRAEQAAMRTEQAEMRAEQHALASLLGKVSDAVTAVAATQEHHGQVLARHSEILGKLANIQANQGARLNTIDGRLAIIEQHVGLVRA
jgi:hypothetical protein